MLDIDQMAYSSRLRNAHPIEKFFFSIVTMVLCLAFNSFAVYIPVILLMSGTVVVVAGIPLKFYLKLLSLPIGFLFIGLITIAISVGLDSPGDYRWLYQFTAGPLWFGVKGDDLFLAANVFGKSLASVSCLYFLSLTTPMVELISLLKVFRVPALFIELMGLIYRFIFVLMETAQKIYTSQSARCGYHSVRSSFSSTGQLISSVFAKSFQRSQLLFTALSARGYTGDLQVLEPEFHFSRRNIILVVIIETLLVITAYSFGGISI